MALAAVCVVVSPMAVDAASTGLSCTPAGSHLNDPQPLHLSLQQMASLKSGYMFPEVGGFRSAINLYLAGDATRNTDRSLADVPRAIMRERFILLNDQPGMFGGNFLAVEFKHHPEAVYQAWLYRLNGGRYEIRALERAICTTAQQRYIRIRYSQMDQLPGG